MLLCFRHYFCLVAKSCPTLCNPMNCSPPGSSVHGISQARILNWVCHFLLRGSSWPRDRTWVSCLTGGFFSTGPPGKPFRHYYPSELQGPSCFRLLHSLKRNTVGGWKNILKLAIARITTSYPLLYFSTRQITLFSKPLLTDLFYSFPHSFSFFISLDVSIFIFLSPLSHSPFLSHWMFCHHASFSGGSEQRRRGKREWWIEVNHVPLLTGSSKTVLLLYVELIINNDLLYSTENSTQYSVMVCNGKWI